MGVKDREELFDKYLIAWGAAQACEEILKIGMLMADQSKFLRKKEAGEIVDNFKIGA